MRKFSLYTLSVSCFAALLVAVPSAAQAADVLINNGSDCSNAANVIDDTTHSTDTVYVRNAGCGTPDPWSPCPSPGDPTEVCVAEGAEVDALYADDSSTVTMSGGQVGELRALPSSTVTMNGGMVDENLYAHPSSTVTINGGSIGWNLLAEDYSTVTVNGGSIGWSLLAEDSGTVTMNGGTVGLDLLAYDSSTIAIVGSDFEINGIDVDYGDLADPTGTLTGTLASGDPIDNTFYQGGGSYTGTITLAPAVAIDIEPWSDANLVDTSGGGTVSVALLGSGTFDVDQVDVTTLAFGPQMASPSVDLTDWANYLLSRLWDVNKDGNGDLISQYSVDETGIAPGQTQACLMGQTRDGTPFAGCDAIATLPACGLGAELAFLLPLLMWLHPRRRRNLT